jgi:seryl-tRNA synthetase
MKQKLELETEKKALIESAAEKDIALRKKIGTIGNIVHDSVPVHNNEVGQLATLLNGYLISV